MGTHEHAGHRKRLMDKVELEALLEHERLEIFLFRIIPRMNTNELAHRLLSRFCSLMGVFSASVEELMQVKGVGENVAKHLYNAGWVYRNGVLPHVRQGQDFRGPFNSRDFLPYVKVQYAREGSEVLDVYLLNSRSEIVTFRRFTDDDGGSVEIEPSELSNLLVKEKPSGIVLVHNHPNGSATSSSADVESTKRCQLVCNMHGVLLCDHIIYAKDGVYSYYLSGELQKISRSFSVSKLTEEKEIVQEKGEK